MEKQTKTSFYAYSCFLEDGRIVFRIGRFNTETDEEVIFAETDTAEKAYLITVALNNNTLPSEIFKTTAENKESLL